MKTQKELDENMLVVRRTLFKHRRNIERLYGHTDISDNPVETIFSDPGVQRAYECVQAHIWLMQGEYFAMQYSEAARKGLI